MRDALVTSDAGFALCPLLHLLGRLRALLVKIHRVEGMAVATFPRLIGGHRRPHATGQLAPARLELLGRPDRSDGLVVELVGRPHLADELRPPLLRDMAVRADGAHAGGVLVAHRRLVFDEDGIPHLMARHAELEAVRVLENGVEAAPQDDSDDDAAESHRGEEQSRLLLHNPAPPSADHLTSSLCGPETSASIRDGEEAAMFNTAQL